MKILIDSRLAKILIWLLVLSFIAILKFVSPSSTDDFNLKISELIVLGIGLYFSFKIKDEDVCILKIAKDEKY